MIDENKNDEDDNFDKNDKDEGGETSFVKANATRFRTMAAEKAPNDTEGTEGVKMVGTNKKPEPKGTQRSEGRALAWDICDWDGL